MTDHRIALIREALLKTHGLRLPDSEIRTLLVAIDAVGVPLAATQTVTVGAREPDVEFLSLTFEFPEPHLARFPGAMSPFAWEQTR